MLQHIALFNLPGSKYLLFHVARFPSPFEYGSVRGFREDIALDILTDILADTLGISDSELDLVFSLKCPILELIACLQGRHSLLGNYSHDMDGLAPSAKRCPARGTLSFRFPFFKRNKFPTD